MAKSENVAAGRAHRATYATDKRNGGYIVRVEGPLSNKFAAREVPVTTRDGKENLETLDRLIWSGVDKESGKPIALYTFKAKPRNTEVEVIPF